MTSILVGYGACWTRRRAKPRREEPKGIYSVSWASCHSSYSLLISAPIAKSAKKRRIAARIARRSASTSTAESRAPPVPLHEQSIDLPSAPQNRFGRNVDVQAGEKAREAREELTASMRQKRRKNIREANFLKGMR